MIKKQTLFSKKPTLAAQLAESVSKVQQAVPAARQKVVEHIEPTVAALRLEEKYIRHYWRPYWRQGALAVGCLLSYQGVQIVGAYVLKTVVDGATATQALNPLTLPLLGGAFLVSYPVGLWLNLKGEQLTARGEPPCSKRLTPLLAGAP